MLPVVLIVAFGVGAYLLYDGLTRPHVRTPERHRLHWVGDWLRQSGLREVTPRDFVLFSLAAGLASGLIVQLSLGWPVVSSCAAIAGALAPTLYYRRRHDRRRAAVQEALVEAVMQLRDSIRAGLDVQEALTGLSRNGPQILRPEFATLDREARLLGLERALASTRARMADPVFDLLIAGLIWNDRLGGRHITSLLDRLAHTTREQMRVRKEVRAYQVKNVLAARVVAAVPLVVLVGIRLIDAPYVAVFNDLTGQLVLAACLASIVLGYAAMLRLTRLPEEPRILQ